jgi:mannosyl-3-phosphoglycerate phosphatase family protein
MKKLVIYTDLDGSLLDHDSYSHAPADALLAELEAHGIPVIIASSKTRSEQIPLRNELGNQHPFIVENGAAVFIPVGYFKTRPSGTVEENGYWIKRFSLPRQHWLGIIADVSADFSGEFTNFDNMNSRQIVSLTGLSEAAAALAASREFGEPVHWTGSDKGKQRFIRRLEQSGAHVLQGGRFLHVSGDCDKGSAMQWLHGGYARQADGMIPASLAIGDSQNDAAMLEAADYALIIRSASVAEPTLLRSERTLRSSKSGPGGWDEGVRNLLHSLNLLKGSTNG